LVCVDGDASDDDAAACRSEFDVLTRHEWTYTPEFVDQVDEVPVSSPDDLPTLRTVGICLELPEPEPTANEAAVRRDVGVLIETMSQLAKRSGIEFAVEYRSEQVGFLDGGPADARVVHAVLGSA
jgi:hypothetical protein